MKWITTGGVFRTLTTATVLTAAATVNLPSYPLAVKSPYLSTWVPGNQLSHSATAVPQFWAGQNLTWPIVARVNNKLYSLFGNPGNGIAAATTTSVSFTSSHTLVQLTAGAANILLDFFTPVLPGTKDYVNQSLPYSYLTVTAGSSSQTISVQILSGIDQTWTAQNGAADLNYTSSGSAGWFWFFNPNQIPYTESSDMATYGSTVYGTTTGQAVSYACDSAANIYSSFNSRGQLSGRTSCRSTDLAVLAKNLGNISSGKNASVTFVVGSIRELSINYLGQQQTGLYRSLYPTIPQSINAALSSFASFQSTSYSFDSTVRSKAQAVSSTWGSQYADIIEASVRQAFAAAELTVPASNLSAAPWLFLKEISSDGNVNTMDVIFQSWPIWLSLNPAYLKLVLDPVLAYLQSGLWPQPFVVHDIGAAYPNASGHNDGHDESMPLFETSSLFIMLYGYQKFTNDSSLYQKYSKLLPGYANYLAVNSLYPALQLISVDAINAAPNQTALAIQSAIGLNAAAALTGNKTLSSIASANADKIYNQGLGLDAAKTHFTYYYGEDETWNVVFTAFSDVVLGLNTFPSSAWQLQSNWYLSQMQVDGLPFAGPITYTDYTGTGINWGLADWNVVFASVGSAQLQQEIINTTHAFLTNGLNTIPFGTKYIVEGSQAGQWIANKDRSTVGSFFAPLVLADGTFGMGF